jgi:hypothetical protein
MGWFSSLVGGVVGFFIGGPVGAVIGAGIGATKIGEKVVNKVLDFVTKPFMNLFGAPDMGGAANEAQRQQGVLIQRVGGNESIPVIYGFRAVGGVVVYAETGPENSKPANKYLWVAYVFCEGPVEGLKTLAIDDNELPQNIIELLNAGQIVTVNGIPQGEPGWKYNGRVQMEWFPGILYNGLGTVFGRAEENPVGKLAREFTFTDAPGFTDKYIFNGLAVLLCRYEMKEINSNEEAENNPFTGSVPQIRAGIMGRRVIDIATRTYTNGVFDPVKTAQENTIIDEYWATCVIADSLGINSYDVAYNFGNYTTNPVSCLLDYLRNPRYGKGLYSFDIDINTWKAAANKCNQHVTYYTGARGPILTMNYVLDTSQTLFNNVKAMLTNFRGYMPYVQGLYKINIEDAGNATDIISSVASIVATAVPGNLTRDAYDPVTFGNVYEIIGDVTYSAIDKNAKYNQVVVTYVDPDQKWSNQQEVWPPTELERIDYVIKDGFRENKGEFTFAAITNKIMARDMARLILLKSRFQESCSLRLGSEAMELEPGDIIRIRSNILDFNDVAWRVVSTRLNADFTVEVGCVRNPATIYPYINYDRPDVLRPPYLPKNNEIYVPGVNSPLMGIFPPSYAPLPPDWTGNFPPGKEDSNLPPTDPTDVGSPEAPGGGGIGGGEGAVDNGTVVVNPQPAPPVIIKTTDDIIQFTGAKLNGNTWTVTFNTDNITNYGGLSIWYRPQLSGINDFFELPSLGTGVKSFSFVTATPNFNISVVTRVRYNDGDFSTAAGRITLAPQGVSGISKDGSYNFSSLNVVPETFYNVNAPIEVVDYSNAPPGQPFSATFRVKEPITTSLTQGVIGSVGIRAIHMWYRAVPVVGTDQGYFRAPTTPVNNTVAYETFTVTLNSLFGVTAGNWEFIVQWEFEDGVMGGRQRVFRAFIDGSGSTGFVTNLGERESQPVLLRAPIATVNNTATISITSIDRPVINGQIRSDGMRITFRNPSNLGVVNWSGLRVELARLVAGQTVIYQTYQKTSNWTILFGTDLYQFDILGVPEFVQTNLYNMVVTLAFFDQGQLQFSTHARKYTGRYSTGIPGNQLGNLVEDASSPGLRLQLIGDTGLAYGPAANKQFLVPSSVEQYALPSLILFPNNPIKVRSFRVNFTVPSNVQFNRLRIYRRTNAKPNAWQLTPTPLDFDNVGEWEWTDVAASSITVRGSVNDTPFSNNLRQVDTSTNLQVFLRLYTGSGAGVASSIVVVVPLTRITLQDGTYVTSWTNSFNYSEGGSLVDLDLAGFSWLKTQLEQADQRPPSETAFQVFWNEGQNRTPRQGFIK